MHNFIKFLVFFITALYCSYAYIFFFNAGVTGIKPLYWHLFTISSVLAIILLRLPSEKPSLPRDLTIWLWLFLCNTILCYLYSAQGEIETQALIEGFQLTALLISFLILLKTNDAIKITRFAFFVVLLFSVSINFIDFINPMWTKVAGRAAGLYANPTISGKILVLLMILSVPIIPRKVRLLYCMFAAVGVFLTFSRGPWLFWVIAFIGLAKTGYISLGNRRASVVVAGLLTSFVLYNVLTGGVLELVSGTRIDEYLTPGTLGRLGGIGAAFTDYSAASRAEVAAKAWEVFSMNPWFGAGLAFDQGWEIGAHNTYLRVAAEGGLVRLAIFLWLIILLWKKTDDIGRVALIVYAVSCLTSHDNLRQPALLMILAFLAMTANRISTGADKHIEYSRPSNKLSDA